MDKVGGRMPAAHGKIQWGWKGMEQVWLGIDVAKSKFDAALLVEERTYHKVFAMDSRGFEALDRWLAQQGAERVHACMEATGEYGAALALYLHESGHVVSVVNPVRIAAYGRSALARNKTDKTDAALIAHFCRSQHPVSWSPPPADLRELQELVRRVEILQEMAQQEKNRRQSLANSPAVQASIAATLEFLEGEISRVREQISEHLGRSEELGEKQQQLCSIPGIGEWTAARILAEIETVRESVSARQLAAYAGLTPRHRASGNSVRGQPRLSKTGNSRLRKALYMPAIVAMRHNPVLREFAERLRERGKHPMVIVGAVMRKLLHIIYGVLRSATPFDPSYLSAAA